MTNEVRTAKYCRHHGGPMLTDSNVCPYCDRMLDIKECDSFGYPKPVWNKAFMKAVLGKTNEDD